MKGTWNILISNHFYGHFIISRRTTAKCDQPYLRQYTIDAACLGMAKISEGHFNTYEV